MTEIYWPETLPQKINTDNFTEKPQKQFVRSQMSVGPPKQRRRFSVGKVDYDFSMIMSTTDMDEFKEFFHEDIHDGALKFQFPDPYDVSDYITVRFRDIYEINNVGYDAWEVTMKIEKLPK